MDILRGGDIYNAPGVNLRGIEASGGVVSDFQVGLDVYRAHVFEHTGTFEITDTAVEDCLIILSTL